MNARQISAGIHSKRIQVRSDGLEGLKLDQWELKNLRRTVDLQVHRISSRPGEQLTLLELQKVVLLGVILDVDHTERHATCHADVTFLIQPEARVTALRVVQDFQNVWHVGRDKLLSLTPGDLAGVGQADGLTERVLAFDAVAEQRHIALWIGEDRVLQIPGARGEHELAFEENRLLVLHEGFAFLAAPFTDQIGVGKAVLLCENLEGCCASDDSDGGDDNFFHDDLPFDNQYCGQYKPISRRASRGPVDVEF